MDNICEKSVEENAFSSIGSKLGMCEVCASNNAIYTCPRCEVKTCSVKCVRIHKQELECDGTRDKAKFIPLNKFTNLDLTNDYRFLEEVTRSVKLLKKNKPRNPTFLPKHLFLLCKAASARKITLRLLPKNFVRRKENTTYLDFSTKTIYWRIEWIFSNDIKFIDDKVPETSKLSSLLQKYLVPQEDCVIQEKLKYFQAVDVPGIRLFLKAEQKCQDKYFELDPLSNLKENLKNRVIIEFPTIHVTLKEHSHLFEVVDSDEEYEQTDAIDVKKCGKLVVDKIIKKSENEDTTCKNLLFSCEISDEESDPD